MQLLAQIEVSQEVLAPEGHNNRGQVECGHNNRGQVECVGSENIRPVRHEAYHVDI